MTTASLSNRFAGCGLLVARRAEARIRVALHQNLTDQGGGKHAQHHDYNPLQHLPLSLCVVGFVGSHYFAEGAI